MNNATWETIKQAGEHWNTVSTKLAEARQRVAELEPEERDAFAALQQAIEAARDAPAMPTTGKTKRRWTCEHCGKEMALSSRKKHLDDKHPGAVFVPARPGPPKTVQPVTTTNGHGVEQPTSF